MANLLLYGIDEATGKTKLLESGDTIEGLDFPIFPDVPVLIDSGTDSVNNNSDTLLHSIATPSSTDNYLFLVNFDPATDPSTDIEWGNYATNYSDGAGYGKWCIKKLSSGELEFRVRFDQGGMSSAKNIKWSIYTVKL